MQVSKKVIIVTGAGSGMGRELTLNLLSKGAKVAAIDLNETSLAETFTLSKDHGSELKTYLLNITDKEKVETTVQNIIADFGHVEGIINNAGIIQPFVKVKDLGFDTIERVMNVNFYGTLYLIKALLPHFLTRPEAHIVNISSMGGFLPVPGQTIYGASKAAVKLFTEGLHSELMGTNVHVSVVFPGAIATNITTNSGIDMPKSSNAKNSKMKPLPAYEAAEIIIEGMEKNSYHIMVGKDAKFLDLFYRFSPKRAASFIANKMKELMR